MQAQAGWLQHDFGHLSVFSESKWNHWVHKFVIGHLKVSSRCWVIYQGTAQESLLSKTTSV